MNTVTKIVIWIQTIGLFLAVVTNEFQRRTIDDLMQRVTVLEITRFDGQLQPSVNGDEHVHTFFGSNLTPVASEGDKWMAKRCTEINGGGPVNPLYVQKYGKCPPKRGFSPSRSRSDETRTLRRTARPPGPESLS